MKERKKREAGGMREVSAKGFRARNQVQIKRSTLRFFYVVQAFVLSVILNPQGL